MKPTLAILCGELIDGQTAAMPSLERLIAYGGNRFSSTQPRDTDAAGRLEIWQQEILQALCIDDDTKYQSAPLTWLGANGTVQPGSWLHADPVFLSMSIDGLSLQRSMHWSSTAINEVERLVREHLAACRVQWCVAHDKVFLHFEQRLDVSTTPPKLASERLLHDALPQGRDAIVLRRLMTELQMLIHEKLPFPSAPNGIWLWGVGEVCDLPKMDLPFIFTDEAYVRGLYCLHTMSERCLALPKSLEPIVDSLPDGQSIVVLGANNGERLEQDWFAPALEALDQGRLANIDLYVGNKRCHAKRSLMRRVFSRTRPLSESLS